MLAITTPHAITTLDHSLLKRAPSSVPSCISLIETPNASAWSSDNTVLYVASNRVVHKYDPKLNSIVDVYEHSGDEAISAVVSKDNGTLILAIGDKVNVLELGSSPKIAQTFDTHKSTITALSLSNDASLLASTSVNSAHVHNISLSSHTVLRGLGQVGNQTINACTFHPHSRTKLLLGAGKQLLVYDTTRPSGPARVIALNDSSGDITAIACSPFSKTLVAAATSSGHVGLIDLEKDKGLFRTLTLKVPLTSITFSPEGAAIYIGTETGKLLVMDLRSLDKVPKTTVISEAGDRIQTINVQKKTKGTSEVTKSAAKDTTTVGSRITKAAPTASPMSRKTALKPDEARQKTRVTTPAKKVFSPVRDPLGNVRSVEDISVEMVTLKNVTPAKKVTKEALPPTRRQSVASPKTDLAANRVSASSARTTLSPSSKTNDAAQAPRRARTVPTGSSRIRKTSTTSEAVQDTATALKKIEEAKSQAATLRPRVASSASRAGSDRVSTRSRATSSASRPGSSASSAKSGMRGSSSPVPPVPSLPVNSKGRSRTPSPDLPDVQDGPITPFKGKTNGRGVLGLGTPEVDAWLRDGDNEQRRDKGKGKAVGFTEGEFEKHDQEETERERERSLSMQISPRRPSLPSSGSGQPMPQSWVPSPARPTGSAHDLLRTIVQDVMLDFQQENKAQMMGLHLDMVRMGRGWRQELRTLMDEYVGDLRELREENARLREENRRLRREY